MKSRDKHYRSQFINENFEKVTVEGAEINGPVQIGSRMKLMIESVVGLVNNFHIHNVKTSNGLTSDVRELVLVDEGCINPSFSTNANVEPYSNISPDLSQTDGDVHIDYNQFGFYDPSAPDGEYFKLKCSKNFVKQTIPSWDSLMIELSSRNKFWFQVQTFSLQSTSF